MSNSCCNIVYNSEIILNEAHANNFIFVLDRIPVSFLSSKFNNEKCIRSIGPSSDDYAKFNNIDAYQEANNDVRNLALFTQKANIPGISIERQSLGLYNTADVQFAGPKMKFDTFTTTIQVDENFFIPRFFYHWLVAAANPESIQHYTQGEYTRQFYTDGHLILLDNNRDKTIEIKFEGMHPTSVSPIELVSNEPNKIWVTIEWLYTSWVLADEYKVLYSSV
jgi:hypothetical protein